jgi:tetratricopeptide (TPR) repeat protein
MEVPMQWLKMSAIAGALVGAIGLTTVSFAQERFDYQVRDAMFRAFGGNEAAFQSAMSIIDEKLGENPDHAEALVWRGAARYWQAGKAFAAGDRTNGQSLATTGMADMDRALALEPNTIGVLVPRAAVLLVAARNQPDTERTRNLATRAAANFETAFTIREPALKGLGQHNRGEYLSGLAESFALAGDRAKAETYLRRVLAELPNSPYSSSWWSAVSAPRRSRGSAAARARAKHATGGSCGRWPRSPPTASSGLICLGRWCRGR